MFTTMVLTDCLYSYGIATNSCDDPEQLTPPKKRHRRNEDELPFGMFSSQGSQSEASQCVYKSWSVDEVADELKQRGLENLSEIFRDHEISGSNLIFITDDHLKSMGVVKVGSILDFHGFLQEIGCRSNNANLYHPKTKIFNDPIHGHIELHPLCVKVIDTPQFQRLRFLSQLGTCYFVYPGASHNRFEHCLGVCHLAGQLARTLQRRQPELLINEKDILCVELAGLCHDLGHGPFSHLFEGDFIPRTTNRKKDEKWKHEDASVEMFDHLVRVNNLEPVFEQFGLSETDRIFIKEQIKWPQLKNGPDTNCKFDGRSNEKQFLYEIVANNRNGIDVDKWDYFARDSYMLGISNNFDHDRCMKFARVIPVDGVRQICTRDKEMHTLYDMFQTRTTLHRKAYQHKVNKILDVMITDALLKANDHIRIPGSNGKMLKMSECIHDMEAYTKLTDHIIHQILLSTQPELQESRAIINDIFCRRLYKYIGQTQPFAENMTSDKIKSEILKCISDEDRDSESTLELKDVIVQMVYLDYGMKDKDPMENVRCYNKKNPDTAVEIRKSEVSHMLPEKFSEKLFLVYCRDVTKFEIADRCFAKWQSGKPK